MKAADLIQKINSVKEEYKGMSNRVTWQVHNAFNSNKNLYKELRTFLRTNPRPSHREVHTFVFDHVSSLKIGEDDLDNVDWQELADLWSESGVMAA